MPCMHFILFSASGIAQHVLIKMERSPRYPMRPCLTGADRKQTHPTDSGWHVELAVARQDDRRRFDGLIAYESRIKT